MVLRRISSVLTQLFRWFTPTLPMFKLIKQPLAYLGFMLAMLFSGVAFGQQTLSASADRVVMTVNGDPITASDLAKRERLLRQQLSANQQVMPREDEIRQQARQKAITETIIVNLARKQGLYPSRTEVDSAIVNASAQENMTAAEFLDKVKANGSSIPEYRSDLADSIALTRMRDRYLAGKVKVTDAEVSKFMFGSDSGIKQSFEVFALLLSKTASAGSTPPTLAQAQALRDNAAASNAEQFKQLQTALANTPKEHVVDLGIKQLEQLPSSFASAIEGLRAGQTSRVVETSGGYYVLRVNNVKLLYPSALQTKASHILFTTPDGSGDSVESALANQIYYMLVLNPTRFEALARQYSKDGSAANGGDLGALFPGDTVPEFERTMDVLQIGEISRPVKSPFGWHIIRVSERENKEIPIARMNAQAKQLLTQQKAEAEVKKWIESLNQSAFVDYR